MEGMFVQQPEGASQKDRAEKPDGEAKAKTDINPKAWIIVSNSKGGAGSGHRD